MKGYKEIEGGKEGRKEGGREGKRSKDCRRKEDLNSGPAREQVGRS